MVERASPVQQRKALEVANEFIKVGVGFVPVPVANSEEFEKLAQESLEKMAAMLAAHTDE